MLNTSIKVELVGDIHLCRDKKDDFVLETAIKGNANYLITRDDDIKRDLELINHLKEYDVQVISVSQFLKMLESITMKKNELK